jgi:hypothetical protein
VVMGELAEKGIASMELIALGKVMSLKTAI